MVNLKKSIIGITLHLLAIGVLVLSFWPFAQKYLFAAKPSGNDYYVGLNYVEFLHRYFSLPPAGWENFWYSGEPVIKGYPWFHYYMVQPLAAMFGTAWGLEIYSVATLFLFFVFSYLLFWEISRNRLFSLLLTVLLLNSRSVFNALPWNGFIAGSATQMFSPLAVYLTLRFCRSHNRKFLLAASLVTGFALLGHPLTGGFFVGLPSVLLLLLWADSETKFWSSKKIGNCIFFGLMAALVASPVFYSLGIFYSDGLAAGLCRSDACWGKPAELIRSLNPLYYLLLAYLTGLIFILKIFRQKISLRLSFIFLVPLLCLLGFFVAAKLDLIGFLSITIWPERATWVASLYMGIFLASLLGAVNSAKPKIALASGAVLLTVMGVAWLAAPYKDAVFLQTQSLFSGVGAYPGESYYYATDKYQQKDVQEVLPAWLNKDENSYRLESQNYMLNFWWTLPTKMPATRGYVHFFNKNQSFWNGWLTAGLTNFWGESITRPESIAQNTALYLLDWHAIRYLEDSNRTLGVDNPYIDYLLKEPVSDRYESVQGGVGNIVLYRIAETATSPIVKASNAKTMLVVGLKDNFVYDNITKVLAAEDINSRFLIPVRGPDTLDELKNYRLGDFDLIFLNDYRYKEFRSWKILADYVNSGGRLIIDTGTQVRESDSATLPPGETQFPEVFPMSVSKRDSLGDQWQLAATPVDHPIMEGIDTAEFGALVYESSPWKLSFVPTETDLRADAQVVLAQAGHPFLVSRKIGQGEVVWSGMNLPYHFLYYDRPAEAKLFRNILSYLLGGLPGGDTQFSVERKRPEEVKITGQNFSGVVFKENFDAGWEARVNGQAARIYSAGPDFMYIRVPNGVAGDTNVEFFYRGTNGAWLIFLLSLSSVGVIIYSLIFGKRPRFNLLAPLSQKFSSWWSKEGEE